MKVEFLVNQDINDGRQIFITESEFKKAVNNEEEFNSFAFATNCLFAIYGYPDVFVGRDEYEEILKSLGKGGAVIISVLEEMYPRGPELFAYVSNNNRLKRVI